MAARTGLVDIVRDFIAVHQRFERLFERFRAGSLQFEEVRNLVADSDSSILYRLKERVHGLFRGRDSAVSLRRGEALFDLAVGSLFHEALKFRENLYQLEVYGPKVRALREETQDGGDELLVEFEKILRAASNRLGESLRETETLLEQTRRQLLALLIESVQAGTTAGIDLDVGLVTRFVLDRRESVEAVYTEGVESLLSRLHGDLPSAYRSAIESHLASAHFDAVLELIAEARVAVAGCDRKADVLLRYLEHLEPYARGMRAFLDGDYAESLEAFRSWVDCPEREPRHVELAVSVLTRLPDLIDAAVDAMLLQEARAILAGLEKGRHTA